MLPAALQRIRRKLTGSADGDRQMVKILAAVLSDGPAAVEAACQEALRDGVHSADIVINILARHREPAPPITIMTPDALRLLHAPVAELSVGPSALLQPSSCTNLSGLRLRSVRTISSRRCDRNGSSSGRPIRER